MMRKNGNVNLSAAVALLIQNQAAFVASMHQTHLAIAGIMGELAEIKSILMRHEQMLGQLSELRDAVANLPEAIRQKIGFKPK